jgi:hypothetical protein
MGHPRYGYAFSQVLDEHGRRSFAPLASEQALIGKMAALHDAGNGFADIARQLTAEGICARRGGEWRGRVISVILQREGRYTVRPHKEYAPRVPIGTDHWRKNRRHRLSQAILKRLKRPLLIHRTRAYRRHSSENRSVPRPCGTVHTAEPFRHATTPRSIPKVSAGGLPLMLVGT